MKQLIKNYAFNTAAKTITLADFATVTLDRLALITDTTTNKILYNFADSSVSSATIATNVITLSTLQGGESSGDKLRIDYDVVSGDPTYDTAQLPSGAATAANQSVLLTELQLKADLTETQPVSVASLPSHAVTNAGTFAVQAAGDVAAAATDSGSPVKVGAKFNSTQPTYTDGQRGDLQIDSRGNLRSTLVVGGAGTVVVAQADNADAVAASATTNKLGMVNRNTVYNGTTWDRMPGDATGVKTKVTDGTNIVNVLKSDGTAAGQNAGLSAGTFLSQALSVTSVSALTGVDVGNYSWVSVHIATQYTGTAPTITWQGSNDNTNWVGMSLIQPLSTLASGSLNTTASGVVFAGPLNFRYFRLNFTGAYSSGTAAGTIIYSSNPRQVININGQVSLNGTTSVNTASATGSAVPANAFYIGITSSTATLVGLSSIAALATDGQAGNTTAATAALAYNGTTYDRTRINTTGVVIAAGTTSTQTNIALTTYNARGLTLVVNVSAVSGGSITVAINGTTASSYQYPLLTSVALNTVAVTPLRIFPAATVAANTASNDVLPRNVQVTVTVTGSITYGVDYVLGI